MPESPWQVSWLASYKQPKNQLSNPFAQLRLTYKNRVVILHSDTGWVLMRCVAVEVNVVWSLVIFSMPQKLNVYSFFSHLWYLGRRARSRSATFRTTWSSITNTTRTGATQWLKCVWLEIRGDFLMVVFAKWGLVIQQSPSNAGDSWPTLLPWRAWRATQLH